MERYDELEQTIEQTILESELEAGVIDKEEAELIIEGMLDNGCPEEELEDLLDTLEESASNDELMLQLLDIED